MKDERRAPRGEIFQQPPPIRIWRLGDVCETVQGPYRSLWQFPHEGLMIGLVKAGVVDAAYRGAFHRLERGAIVVVQPEQVVGFEPIRSASEPSRICVHCPAPLLQTVMNEFAGRQIAMQLFPEVVRSDPYLATLVRDFNAARSRPPLCSSAPRGSMSC